MIIPAGRILKGVDTVELPLSIKKIFKIDTKTPSRVTTRKEEYVFRKLQEVEFTDSFVFEPRSQYEVMFEQYVIIPAGACSIVTSTHELIENLLFVTGGLYDTGFNGHVGATIHNTNRSPITISDLGSVCKMYFYKSENVGQYSGSYSHSKEVHWADNKEYH